LQAQRIQTQTAQEAVARDLLQQFEALILRAEAACAVVRKAAEPMDNASDPPTDSRESAIFLLAATAVEKTSQAAIEACQACDAFAAGKLAVICQAETIRIECERAAEAKKARALASARLVGSCVQRAMASKDKVLKAIRPTLFARNRENMFKKYDVDEDGFLNRQEVLAYAAGEFGFEMRTEHLDRIFSQLVTPTGAPGIAPPAFQRLRTATAIARHEGVGRHAELKKPSPAATPSTEASEATAPLTRGMDGAGFKQPHGPANSASDRPTDPPSAASG